MYHTNQVILYSMAATSIFQNQITQTKDQHQHSKMKVQQTGIYFLKDLSFQMTGEQIVQTLNTKQDKLLDRADIHIFVLLITKISNHQMLITGKDLIQVQLGKALGLMILSMYQAMLYVMVLTHMFVFQVISQKVTTIQLYKLTQQVEAIKTHVQIQIYQVHTGILLQQDLKLVY